PVAERELRHDRLRDRAALPHHVAAVTVVEVDARHAAGSRAAEHHGREDVVAGVVLDDQRVPEADDRVLRGARSRSEERLPADEALYRPVQSGSTAVTASPSGTMGARSYARSRWKAAPSWATTSMRRAAVPSTARSRWSR